MLRDLTMSAFFGLILMCVSACGKAGGEPAPGAKSESTQLATEVSAKGAALEWLRVGELPVQANVPAGSTVRHIGRMWSVRTPGNWEFRVTPPLDEAMMAASTGKETLERELARAKEGVHGDLKEVLLNEPGEAEWFLGYTRADRIRPAKSEWVLASLRSIGDVEYKCSSNSGGDAEVYECALQACRTLRAAQ